LGVSSPLRGVACRMFRRMAAAERGILMISGVGFQIVKCWACLEHIVQFSYVACLPIFNKKCLYWARETMAVWFNGLGIRLCWSYKRVVWLLADALIQVQWILTTQEEKYSC
jgi:hypothetical protein